VANVHQLVEQDHVVGMAGMVGTAPSVASEPFLNAHCVPQLWVQAGSPMLASPSNPFTSEEYTYQQEGEVMGEYIRQHFPHDTVAILYQDDDIGGGIRAGLKTGLAGSQVKVVGEQPYQATDATVSSQMTTLAATKANIFINASFSTKCSQALDAMGNTTWRPMIFIGTDCADTDIAAGPASVAPTGRVESVNYLESPAGTATDEKLYRRLMKADGLGANQITIIGYQTAEMVVDTLEHARQLSPVGIAEAAKSLPATPPALFLPGVQLADGNGRPALSAFQVQKWNATTKHFTGGVVFHVGT
jgi:branched-chain amino acid transport system substrate-binding protein